MLKFIYHFQVNRHSANFKRTELNYLRIWFPGSGLVTVVVIAVKFVEAGSEVTGEDLLETEVGDRELFP